MASTASEQRQRPVRDRTGRPAPPALLAVSALVACLFATPLAYLAIRGLREGGTLGAAWASGATLGPLARTLLLGVTVAAASAGLGTTLA